MTHDSRFAVRFENHSAFLRAAVVYDFIPLDWPNNDYLPTLASRIGYLAKMARLQKFDFFLPISEYTAWRLSELLDISRDRIQVTGASVRRCFYEHQARVAPQPSESPSYFFMVIAQDARKNAEVAVKAVRELNRLHGRQIRLKVAGHYDDARMRELLHLAGQASAGGFLQFCPNVSDQELVRLYQGAMATIVSSHMEGFSLPVVEASACRCPVIASDCAAHLELIEQPEALFPSDDAPILTEKLDALFRDPTLRGRLLAAQGHLATRFDEESVGERFWSGIEAATEKFRKFAFVARSSKPRLAFMSPYPPDESGVARYTAMTMQAGEKIFDSYLYSDAARPLTFYGDFRDMGNVSIAPVIAGNYNAVISVLGNSHFHNGVFEVFERYGGPCILHDARLTQIYFRRLGQDSFLRFAAQLLGRTVGMDEVYEWLQDRNPLSLFLEPIVARASPLMVHTVTQKAEIKKRYGAHAEVITSCPTLFFQSEELTPSARAAARERIGIAQNAFVVSSFGIVDPVKGMSTCILALELCRSWNIPIEFYFVGDAGQVRKQEVEQLAALYGVGEYVHTTAGFVSEAIYRDFLIASDAAVQLRTYGFGQFSAALTDCISAALYSVANKNLAISCDAPAYVSQVPDRFSPLQVAEGLAAIWESGASRSQAADERLAYLATHNFTYYAERLIQILGLA